MEHSLQRHSAFNIILVLLSFGADSAEVYIVSHSSFEVFVGAAQSNRITDHVLMYYNIVTMKKFVQIVYFTAKIDRKSSKSISNNNNEQNNNNINNNNNNNNNNNLRVEWHN